MWQERMGTAIVNFAGNKSRINNLSNFFFYELHKIPKPTLTYQNAEGMIYKNLINPCQMSIKKTVINKEN